LGGTFVGTALIALTTSLPEIITTFAAVRMGAFEMAAGNIFGSNCFNMAIVPIVDLFYRPGPILQAVEPTHAITACSVIIVTGLATMGLLYRVEKRYWLLEPDALLVMLLSAASLVAITLLGGS
jgi:cation:H+ antiporter